MPQCGSHILWCNLPIRFDTYRGCSYNCLYCREHKKLRSNEQPITLEGKLALKRFIAGQRTHDTKWCDWKIPLQWGGISDPFQPYEEVKQLSHQCLKIFADTYYPVVITTKSTLISRFDYLSVLGQCNAVIQISMACEKYDRFEPYAPCFQERLRQLPLLSSNAMRVLVRVQPYIRVVKKDIIKHFRQYRDAGVYGVMVSTIALNRKRYGFVKHGDLYIYTEDTMQKDYSEIRNACHDVGLKFFCPDGRLRYLSDSKTCCGCEGMDGFNMNKVNMNYATLAYTEKMQQPGTGEVFGNIWQRNPKYNWCRQASYKQCLEDYRLS